MDRMTDELAGWLPLVLGAAVVPIYVLGGYLAILIDRQRKDSANHDDTQVGLKLVLFALLLFGVITAVGSVERIVAMMLGGFHELAAVIKATIGGAIVGAGTALVIGFVLLPRTNLATARQPERFALGLLALVYGTAAIFMLAVTIDDAAQSAAWAETSSALGNAAISAVVALVAIGRLGARSGWAQPTAAMPPMQQPPGFPPPQPPPGLGGGGYPPPQGGGYYGPPGGGNPYQPR
jgi:hypothetical protein